jgi:hypothetical protein
MSFLNSLTNWKSNRVANGGRRTRRPGAGRRQAVRFVPRLELLEKRTVPTVSITNSLPWSGEGPGPILNNPDLLSPGGGHLSDAVGAVETVVAEPIATTVLGFPFTRYVAYAGTVNGGIWRTDNLLPANAGTTQWRPLTDQEPSLSTSSLALDPGDPSGNTLWVGTGELSSAGPNRADRAVGLLKTTDGGATWAALGQQLAGQRIFSVVPTTLSDPTTHEQVVLVACADGQGVLRSTDGGRTFNPVTVLTPLGPSPRLAGTATDLVADPNDPSRFYAAVVGQGVYVSNDGGQDWVPTDDNSFGLLQSIEIRLAVHADGNGTVLYAAVAGNVPAPTPQNPMNTSQQLSGVFRTPVTPAGTLSWTAVGPGTVPAIGVSVFDSHFAVAADPADPNLVYVSGEGNNEVFRGDAAGPFAWTQIGLVQSLDIPNGSRPHADSRHLTFLGTDTLLETDDGGIYGLQSPRTAPDDTPWESYNGTLQDTEFFTIAYDSVNHLIFGGTQDNGTPVQSSSNNFTWVPLGGGDGGQVGFGTNPANTVFYFSSDLDPVRQQNGQQADLELANVPGGARFSGLSPQDQKTVQGENVGNNDFSFTFAVNPSDPTRLLFGGGSLTELYESFDAGRTVTSLTPGLPGSPTAFTYGVNDPGVVYMGFAFNQVFAGTPGGGLEVRSPGGSLTAVHAPPWANNAVATDIVVDPNDWRTAYVLDSTGHVWRTTDAGATDGNWTDLTDNLVGPNAVAIRVDRIAPGPGGVLLASGRDGVFRRLPNFGNPGFTWTRVGQGLPNVEATGLEYVPPDPSGNPLFGDFLLVGTYGRGAWVLPDASSFLGQASTLQVTGDENGQVGADDHIVMQLDPADASKLQIVVNGRVEYDDSYAYFSSVSIDGGLGDDTIDIHDIPASLAVTVTQTEPGGLNVGNAGTLKSIRGPLTIAPGSASILTLDGHLDKAPSSPQTVSISAFGISGLTPGAISFPGGLDALNVMAGAGAHTINLESTQAFTPVSLGLNGSDTVNVSPTLRRLSTIAGSLTIAGDGSTTLVLDDRNQAVTEPSAFTNTYTLDTQFGTDSTVQSSFSSAISYSGVSNVTLYGDDLNDVYQVKSVAAGSPLVINTGAGPNTVNITHTDSNGNKTQRANVQVNGGPGVTDVVVFDRANPSDSYQLTNMGIPIGDPVTVGYSNVRSVTLYGAVSGAYDFEGSPPGTTVFIHLGTGPNTFQGTTATAGVVLISEVTTTADAGPGSLRQAILDADNSGVPSVIDFAIPTSDPGYNPSTGVWTILPASTLPILTHPVVLDATTQPGYSTHPVIELDGANAGAGVTGLTVAGGDSRVLGLAVGGFSGDGIDLTTAGMDTIQGDYLGVNAAGTAALANGGNGVNVAGASGNTIGGLTPTPGTGAGNVISGNAGFGIDIGSLSGTPATGGNVVEGNLIGTDASGTVAIGNFSTTHNNGQAAIFIDDSSGNTIGGTTAQARNVISGNGAAIGVYVLGPDNLLQGNYVGVDVTGNTALPNESGVVVGSTATSSAA